MKDIWVILMIILAFGLVLSFSFAFAHAIETDNCKPYKEAGVETKITFLDGCEVFFKGEFKRVNEVNKYFEVQELKKMLEEEAGR